MQGFIEFHKLKNQVDSIPPVVGNKFSIADCKLLTANYLCRHEDFDGMPGQYLPQSVSRRNITT